MPKQDGLPKALPLAIMLALAMAPVGCSTVASRNLSESSFSAHLRRTSADTPWLTYGHDYSNQRFSQLDQINSSNIASLVPAYVAHTEVVGPFESSPIVADSAMYVTTANDGVLALNAVTGDVRWRRQALAGSFVQCCGQVNRGAAISSDLLLVGRLDGVLLALQRKTGHVKWATAVANNAAGYSITMAPVVYRGAVMVGVGGSDFGIRGSLSAYAVRDGALKWRWYATDPTHWFGPSVQLRLGNGHIADARASESLRVRFATAWKRGGGGIWSTPAIDEKRNAIYVTTGNPWPDFDGSRRPGDNLFTDCIVALDGSTGRLRWYFQETPHDVRDLDSASPAILFDTIDKAGRAVAAVGHAGKTGIFYILDRDSGRLIRCTRSLASFGTSTKNDEVWDGGSSWSPTSFDPNLGYAIVSASQHLK